MKSISTLLIAVFVSMVSFANYVPSKLRVSVASNENIQIVVNNNVYRTGADNSTVINNLQPGYHSVKVYEVQDRRTGIFGRKTHSQLLYSSNIHVRPGYLIDISINRNGRASVKERMIRNSRDNDWGNDGWGNNRDRRNDRDYDRNNGGWDNGGYGNDYRRPVSDQAFYTIIESLRREYNENNRVYVARQAIERNYFTANQVRTMLQLFSFEGNKLEVAKQAYRNTTDQSNYHIIYEQLYSSRSKEELSEYIRRYR